MASPPFAFGFEGGFTGGSSGSSVFLSPGETPSAPSRTWLPKLSPCRHPPAPGNVSLPPARFKGFLFVSGFEQLVHSHGCGAPGGGAAVCALLGSAHICTGCLAPLGPVAVQPSEFAALTFRAGRAGSARLPPFSLSLSLALSVVSH